MIMPMDTVKTLDIAFDNPDSVRHRILQKEFKSPLQFGNYGPAWRCDLQVDELDGFREVENRLAELWGFNIKPVHLEARYSFANANSAESNPFLANICHNDYGVSEYTAVIYLTLPEFCQGGTDFFRYLPANTLRYHPALGRVDITDPSIWELVQTSEMAYNRLLTFPSPLFHSVKRPYFGTELENARLILSIRFNRAQRFR